MLKSRTSIPLLALSVVAVAGCMLYFLTTENIFKTYFVDLNTTPVVNAANDSPDIASSPIPVQEKIELDDELDDQESRSETKPLKPENDGTNEASKPDISEGGNATVNAPMLSGVEYGSAQQTVMASNTDSEENSFAADERALWKKYSQRIPKLYNAPLTKDTEERLGLVAQLSGELDSLYVENRSEWRRRFGELSNRFVAVAVAGEREGARALSFQLIRRPQNKPVDALSWALIANAIAPNDYYLYLCSKQFSVCTEDDFVQAVAQANRYIILNGFVTKNNSELL